MVQSVGAERVDGVQCDNLLAVLRPRLGNSPEDRVVISVDRGHRIRRLRITVDGLASTRGAVADIFLRDPVRVGGVQWPTQFYEQLKRPLVLSVHRWRLTAIDLDRGLDRSSLQGAAFTGAAAAPAGAPARTNQAAGDGGH